MWWDGKSFFLNTKDHPARSRFCLTARHTAGRGTSTPAASTSFTPSPSVCYLRRNSSLHFWRWPDAPPVAGVLMLHMHVCANMCCANFKHLRFKTDVITPGPELVYQQCGVRLHMGDREHSRRVCPEYFENEWSFGITQTPSHWVQIIGATKGHQMIPMHKSKGTHASSNCQTNAEGR